MLSKVTVPSSATYLFPVNVHCWFVQVSISVHCPVCVSSYLCPLFRPSNIPSQITMLEDDFYDSFSVICIQCIGGDSRHLFLGRVIGSLTLRFTGLLGPLHSSSPVITAPLATHAISGQDFSAFVQKMA